MSKYSYEYPMPAVTATCVLLHEEKLYQPKVLVGKRSENADAFPGAWCLPGGFLNTNQEEIEDTAVREVLEETNIQIQKEHLRLFGVFSNPETDPRYHVVNVCFYVWLDHGDVKSMKAGDDLQELEFLDFLNGTVDLAFNHNEILKAALKPAMEGFWK